MDFAYSSVQCSRVLHYGRRRAFKLPKLGSTASGILGPALQGAFGAAGTLGAGAIEANAQQQIANEQLSVAQAAASSAAAAAAAAPPAASAAPAPA